MPEAAGARESESARRDRDSVVAQGLPSSSAPQHVAFSRLLREGTCVGRNGAQDRTGAAADVVLCWRRK